MWHFLKRIVCFDRKRYVYRVMDRAGFPSDTILFATIDLFPVYPDVGDKKTR